MNIMTVSQLASISDLQRNYNSLIAKIKTLAQPIILLRRNKPEAVLVSVKSYEDLLEKQRLYEEKLALEAIEEFERDKRAGRLLIGKTAKDLFRFEKNMNRDA